jgi:hypothetical protein
MSWRPARACLRAGGVTQVEFKFQYYKKGKKKDHLKNKIKTVVEHLPTMHKNLDSIPSTSKRKACY